MFPTDISFLNQARAGRRPGFLELLLSTKVCVCVCVCACVCVCLCVCVCVCVSAPEAINN